MPTRSATRTGNEGRVLVLGVVWAVCLACGGTEFNAGEGDAGAGSAGESSEAGSNSGSSGRNGGGNGSSGTDGSGGTDGSSGADGSGGSGADGSGGTDGSGGPGTCADYMRAACEWQERCSTAYGGSVEACRKTGEASCEWYDLPGAELEGDGFRDCAEVYDDAACDDTLPVCELPAGSLENGFACASYIQCQSGYCVFTTSSCGVCGPDPVHDVGGTCQSYANCKPGLDCREGICSERAKEGEACGGERGCEFLLEGGYLDCVDEICTVVGRLGEPCVGQNRVCGPDAACSSESVCVPLEHAGEGDACGTHADRVIACTGGWCVASDASDEGVCMTWAGPGESCKKVPNFERCADGLTCDAGLCIWPKPVPLPECD